MSRLIFIGCILYTFLSSANAAATRRLSDPTNGCDLPENEIFLASNGDILYHIPDDFAGFQMDLVGPTTIDSVKSGGEAKAAGMTVPLIPSRVFGWSLTNVEVTENCGVLASLELNGDKTSLENIEFADATASTIDVSYHSPMVVD